MTSRKLSVLDTRRCASEKARKTSSGQSTCEYEGPATIAYIPSCVVPPQLPSRVETRKSSIPLPQQQYPTTTTKCFQDLERLFEQGFIDVEELDARRKEALSQGDGDTVTAPHQDNEPPLFIQKTSTGLKKKQRKVFPSQWGMTIYFPYKLTLL